MYWDDLDHHTGAEHLDHFWMAHPRIREEINRRVTGDPALWPTAWFRRELAGRMPFARALSIGCGPGNLERDLVRRGIVASVTGIDIVPSPLAFASGEAAGLPIRYEQADAYEYLRARPASFEAIFFHASLHHFDRVDEIAALVRRALVPGGVLYIDEYIGPSMSQWNVARLLPPNIAYYRLPRVMRRPKLVRTPLNREDPTEAIASADIAPAIEKHFRILVRRDYGGNLLLIIYPNLNKEAPREVFDAGIEKLIAWEDDLLRRGRPSFHAVMVAEV
ncbi:MAG TPA: class I SAM-dependent methyltransferase [Thermoanaerobaculia bacterium]|nr:class I SAM-dependent methyltransferase [Thermoanaerobaculia bacterium]